MGKFVFNNGKAPVIYGTNIAIQPGCYEAFSDEVIAKLKSTSFPLVYEDDPNFKPLWVPNFPK